MGEATKFKIEKERTALYTLRYREKRLLIILTSLSEAIDKAPPSPPAILNRIDKSPQKHGGPIARQRKFDAIRAPNFPGQVPKSLLGSNIGFAIFDQRFRFQVV